ncbi:hypothetical protein [Bradyrhizobium sp. th.b2]|uniref:hypothetical protein n=1 Tax=Bradyrhizobium sp. th-b2 TaxID=172088 RepID=UPI00048BBBAD|nr:hypothetical protein [Bradyrhizobium sp. th.b2]
MSGDPNDFNRLRAQFSRRANAREVPALASKLCWWVAYGHMDTKRRSAFVTQKTLAGDLGGVTVRSVQRMIDVLKPLGLNVAPGHGPDKASTYWIGEANTTSMSPIEADNTTSMSPIQSGQGDTQGDIGVGSRRHFRRQKATLVSRHIKNSKKISKKVSKEERGPAARSADADRESATSSTSITATGTEAPNERAEALIGTVPEPEQQPPSIASKTIGRPAANGANAGRSRDQAYAALWAAYPNHVSENDSRKLFDQLLDEGIDPDMLIAGAAEYAERCQGKPPEQIRLLCYWLRVRCWEDENRHWSRAR